MEKYSNFISFEENFKLNEIHQKILDLALPNIIDYKKRFPEVEIFYNGGYFRFEEVDDIILDSLLKDICVYSSENHPVKIDAIYGWQVFKVDQTVTKFKNNDKDFLQKRLKNYTPILGDFEREKKFIIQTSNAYLEDL